MSKRAATIQLTSDNVEYDEENIEDPGKFEQASEDQLQQRIIRKAVRRGPRLGEVENGGGGGGGIFAGLRGTLGGDRTSFLQPATSNLTQPPQPVTTTTSSKPLPPNHAHLQQLRSLNLSVTEWISKHVRENPYVDLTPIFRDYENHLRNIDEKYGGSGGDAWTESSQESDASTVRDETMATKEEEEGKTEEEDATATDASQSNTEDKVTTDQESQSNDDAQDSDQTKSDGPQKPTTATSDEDDSSLLTTRAKLFYKKGSEYTELGVGMLKVQSSSNKAVRLLLRNNTTLGNVLLNVKISSDVPMSTAKNNVLIVCAPNPPLGKGVEPGEAVTYLIRVKTVEQAEQLLTCIKTNTGQ